MRRAPLLIPLLTLCACYSGGEALEGFVRTEPGEGPLIQWDLDAKPLPEIPFPNDIATRPDTTSPTGRRVNASLEADTAFERKLRRHMSDLDGFGTFAPIWLSFDQRLDVLDIAKRHRGDADFSDDAVFLIDVTKGSPTYGQAQVLDFGNGSFPLTVENPRYFPNDPRAEAYNLLFDTYDERARGDGDDHCDVWEDVNQNGILDPGEDLDGDGRLDVDEDTDQDGVCDEGNLWGSIVESCNDLPYPAKHPGCPNHPAFDLITFYELETETLTVRPLVPLRERTTYAVVVTKRLTNVEGQPVRSPFPYVHHLQQIEAVAPLFEDGLLAQYDLSADDVAFTWSFTTQSVYDTLVSLREGLNGVGSLAHLAEAYPADVESLVPLQDDEQGISYLMPPSYLVGALKTVFETFSISGFDADRVGPLLDTYGAVDYLIAGDYVSPDFLAAGDGVFNVNPQAGTAAHVPESLRFLLVVPKEGYGRAPFPVLMYCHGYTSMKLEALAFAGVFAKYGIATFVIDAYSHGLPLGPELEPLIQALLQQLDGQSLTTFYDAIKKDRARDLNGDGLVDVGGDFWTNDTFHTRDIVRQTLVDYLQANRIFRSFDGQRQWSSHPGGGDPGPWLAGDFNRDGVVDVGGPGNSYYVAGTSMGGILSSILGAVEPTVVAAAPISPGGGLLEVGLRTDLGNVKRAVLLPVMGPMIITEPLAGDPRISNMLWLVNDVFSEAQRPIARVGDISPTGEISGELRPGDIIRVENRTNGTVDEVVVPIDRRARAHIPADVGDSIAITVWRPNGTGEPMFTGSKIKSGATLVKEITTYEREFVFAGETYKPGDPLVAIAQGLGLRRNTPSLRRLLAISQAVLEPADPVNWAPRYADPLEVRPEGRVPTNILYTITMGDMTVPASTGVALARAAGIIGYTEPDPRYGVSQNQLLIDNHVIESVDELQYFRHSCCHAHCGQVNFDIDDLSNGLHGSNLPRLAQVVPPLSCSVPNLYCLDVECEAQPPLRAWAPNHGGVNAVRFPALRARGQHAVDIPDPSAPFDPSMFTINQIGLYLSSNGTVLSDHPCLAKNDCRPCAGEALCPSIPAPTALK